MSQPLIIERPDLQKPLQRISCCAINVVGWIAWLLLIIKLFSVTAFAAEINPSNPEVSGIYKDLFVNTFVSLITICSVVFLLTYSINLFKRISAPQAQVEIIAIPSYVDIAKHFALDIYQMNQIHSNNSTTLSFDPEGKIVTVSGGAKIPQSCNCCLLKSARF